MQYFFFVVFVDQDVLKMERRQFAANNYENKSTPSRQGRRKAKATPAVDSKTWFPVCHLFRQPNYVWLNRRNLFIDNSGSLFLGTFRTNDL